MLVIWTLWSLSWKRREDPTVCQAWPLAVGRCEDAVCAQEDTQPCSSQAFPVEGLVRETLSAVQLAEPSVGLLGFRKYKDWHGTEEPSQKP